MMVFDFFKQLLPSRSKKRAAHGAKRSARFRPWLEPLEVRAVPATFTWTGDVSESWSNPANWAENRIPESGPSGDIDRNDVLIFPQNAARFTSFNDIKGEAVRAAQVEIHGNYAISGDDLRLDSSLPPSRIIVSGTVLQAAWSIDLELTALTYISVGFAGDNLSQFRLDGVISGAGGIVKDGLGTLTVAGHNTYADTTSIEDGTLEVRTADALGLTTAGTTITSQGVLKFGSGSAGGAEPLTVFGELLADVDRSWAGPVTLATNASPAAFAFIRVEDTEDELTLSGPVSGNAGLAKEGAGTLVFAGSAANSYTGATQVREGRLDLNKTPGVSAVIGSVFIGIEPISNGQQFFPTDSAVRLLNDNQIFDTVAIAIGPRGLLDLNGSDDTIGELTLYDGLVTTGSGTLTLNGNLIATSVGDESSALAASTLASLALAADTEALIEGKLDLGSATRTFAIENGPATTDVTITAAISGAGGLTKSGAGRLRLSGTSSYTGTTTIAAGQLVVDGVQSSSPVTVNAGGMLSGSGTVGALTVRSEGIVRPGASLTVTGNATFAGFRSSFQPFLSSGGVNALGATGTLNLNNATLSILDVNVPGALPPLGVPLPVVGAAKLVGKFNGLVQNAIAVSASGLPYRVTYTPNNVLVARLGGPAFVDRAITPIINEGGVATLTGRITTTEPRDKFFLEVNWGDGTRTQIHKVKPGAPRDVALRHRYKDDGTYTVGLLWRDQRGAFNTGTLEVTVRNVAPAVFAGPDVTLRSGGLLSRHGRVFDPGVRDVLTATVDYGDGSGPQSLRLNKLGRYVLHHRYTQPGEFRVTVTVHDGDGGISTDSFLVTVLRRR